MKTRLWHVRANVADLFESIEWYENTLGFKVVELYPKDNPNFAAFEMQDGALFSIMQVGKLPTVGRFNFKVDDVEGFRAKLGDRVTIVEEVFNTSYGTRKFTIEDINGNELGFEKSLKDE